MKLSRRDIWFALLLVGLLIAAYGNKLLTPQKLHGQVIEPPPVMDDFTLSSAQGPVSLSDFHGKVVVLYFGYTFCPDVCPTTLAVLNQAVTGLGDSAQNVQVIFISVDWKRDTPEKLAQYTAHFNPAFLGLTGPQPQIDLITKEFGIFYLLNLPNENGFYSVDHTASTRALDREGRLSVIWPYETPASDIKSDLLLLLNEPG